MARVSDNEVKEIIETDVTTTPFITIANLLVTDLLGDSGLSDAMLKEIERWLSAHFVAIRDPREKIIKTGDAGATFFLGKEGKGLESTPYGLQAMAMDTTGTLANLGKRAAKLDVIDWL